MQKRHALVEISCGPVYKGDAQSILHNKKAYLRKTALGSKKITDIFST
ncbi:13150_t:CDS:1, partial [Funneliformis geosporum]